MADFKRATAYKLRIGDLFKAKKITDGEKLSYLELGEKRINRANLIANIVEKYESGEKQYVSFTLDDASGQIRVKVFGDDVARFAAIGQGDTVAVIGVLREYNGEIYITPEIIRKQDPKYLLVRKIELEKMNYVKIEAIENMAFSDKIKKLIKDSEPEGISSEKLILELHESPDLINQEIKRALEGGIIYEPRPGILRYLGM
ncbi:OB-fold nucleic acid binding domain-containing protein [Candidatus Pacearchaeota archaeon]|nr:OB-fold nucleic acid binding domain-containing protein [Candidatus Pacearchaeota archaeon]